MTTRHAACSCGQLHLTIEGESARILRWSRFLRQAVKVDLMTKRMIHHEDTQAVHG